jgi:hypothetical protein
MGACTLAVVPCRVPHPPPRRCPVFPQLEGAEARALLSYYTHAMVRMGAAAPAVPPADDPPRAVAPCSRVLPRLVSPPLTGFVFVDADPAVCFEALERPGEPPLLSYATLLVRALSPRVGEGKGAERGQGKLGLTCVSLREEWWWRPW